MSPIYAENPINPVKLYIIRCYIITFNLLPLIPYHDSTPSPLSTLLAPITKHDPFSPHLEALRLNRLRPGINPADVPKDYRSTA